MKALLDKTIIKNVLCSSLFYVRYRIQKKVGYPVHLLYRPFYLAPISLYYFLHLLSRELEVTLTDRTGTLRYTLAEPVPFLRVGSGSSL